MKQITTKITNFPSAPDSATDTEVEFNLKADAFVNHQATTYIAEIQNWTTEVNDLAIEVNTEADRAKTEADRAKTEADRAIAGGSQTLPPVTNHGGDILQLDSAGTTPNWVTPPFLPLDGGDMNGLINLANSDTQRIVAKLGATLMWYIGFLANAKDLTIFNSVANSNIKLLEDGTISIHSKAGQKVLVNDKEVVTGKMNGSDLELYLGDTKVKTIS